MAVIRSRGAAFRSLPPQSVRPRYRTAARLPSVRRVVKLDYVTAVYVGEEAHVSQRDEERALLIVREGHPSLEEHILPRLPPVPVMPVTALAVARSQHGELIRREERDD